LNEDASFLRLGYLRLSLLALPALEFIVLTFEIIIDCDFSPLFLDLFLYNPGFYSNSCYFLNFLRGSILIIFTRIFLNYKYRSFTLSKSCFLSFSRHLFTFSLSLLAISLNAALDNGLTFGIFGGFSFLNRFCYPLDI
jgi:hypothetical protein